MADQSAQSDTVSILVGSGSLLALRVGLGRSSWTHRELTIANCLLEFSHCCRFEVNVAQDKAALCTKLERLYYAYGDDGCGPWPGKICEGIVKTGGHDGLLPQAQRLLFSMSLAVPSGRERRPPTRLVS